MIPSGVQRIVFVRITRFIVRVSLSDVPFLQKPLMSPLDVLPAFLVPKLSFKNVFKFLPLSASFNHRDLLLDLVNVSAWFESVLSQQSVGLRNPAISIDSIEWNNESFGLLPIHIWVVSTYELQPFFFDVLRELQLALEVLYLIENSLFFLLNRTAIRIRTLSKIFI